MSATQQNNILTTGTGVVSGVGGWLATGGAFEIAKVVFFAILGGIVSFYVNKFLKYIHK